MVGEPSRARRPAVGNRAGLSLLLLRDIPLDAIPDLSDTQVIVYSRWEQSPNVIEDQVTYPIVTSLLGTPKVKTIRGFSDFWLFPMSTCCLKTAPIPTGRARAWRSSCRRSRPAAARGADRARSGPDAAGVGWVFEYALVDESGGHSLAELRSYQDWFLRYALQAVPGLPRSRRWAER